MQIMTTAMRKRVLARPDAEPYLDPYKAILTDRDVAEGLGLGSGNS